MREISFRWLLNQRSLNLRSIVTGSATFNTIHASELADPSEFTSPGALMLTLGLAFQEEPEGFERYGAALAAAGVQGIGFGTGLAFSEVPTALIHACSPVSYTHLRAHETPEHLVCRLLLEKKKKANK